MKTYKGADFGISRWWKERCLFSLIAILSKPNSYLDLGCGESYLVELMGKLLGEDNAVGVDLDEGSESVITHDLTIPLNLSRKFDMVVSLEVGEHLPEESADTYCDTIANHVGRWLVFSAAQPGQTGYEHINCKPKSYWRGKLEARGLESDEYYTQFISSLWGKFVPYSWAYNNLMIFKR